MRLDAADLALEAVPKATGDDTEVALLRGELAELRRQLAASEEEIAGYSELEAKVAATATALADYEALSARYEALSHHHQNVISSASWKLTGILRRFLSLFRGSSS